MAALAPADFDAALKQEAAAAGAAEAFAAVSTTSLSAPEAAPAAPESEPSQKGGNDAVDGASAAVLGPVIAGAFLLAVLGLGLFLRRRRRKLSKDVAEAIDVDKDVEEPPRIVFHEPPPPPPPLPPQTPGAGSPAGLVELDGRAPPPPPPEDLPQSPKVTPSFWARTMTTVRNLRSNSQDDDDAAPSPVKQVESVTPAPGARRRPATRRRTRSARASGSLAIAGWRGPPPPSPPDRVSFDEELRQFDDDFKEEAVADSI